ncbi:Fe-S cluster assembly protein IscX [uncultured Photobacterium sp.]|uniref:Fe-S cluster assembly protein IscX n=1 Tax=uncultured Photobacterium sp. TaxID=173973 RepID=UPI00263A2125|nr:Fe-S cluster assembly protein IscX [uncultured Photobacterium sp.]
MKWIDSRELAIVLSEQFPDIDPKTILFTDLREWILDLDDFDDDPNHCNERILEAVQMYWIEETE